MKDIIREAALGQVIRFVSGRRLFRYPEEEPGFVPVFEDVNKDASNNNNVTEKEKKLEGSQSPSVTSENKLQENENENENLAAVQTQKEQDIEAEGGNTGTMTLEQTLSTQGKIVVTWYGSDDPANPQNWTTNKKNYILFLIW